ncbi:LOW QUALITY PROTEIN: hypothetical protein OSB04_006017, partial [Centaurea solstitialis]
MVSEPRSTTLGTNMPPLSWPSRDPLLNPLLSSRALLEINLGVPHILTRYRQLVGSLVYLTVTRPDIAYVVHISIYGCPCSDHYAAVIRILRYLKGTMFHGLHFSSKSSLVLRGFSDSDWDSDMTDRRSTTATAFSLATLLSHGAAKNNLSLPGPVLKLSIAFWPTLPKNLFGYVGYSQTWVRLNHPPLRYGVTITTPSRSLTTMSFMSAPNTSKLTAILFVNMLCAIPFAFSLFPLSINRPTSSPKLIYQDGFASLLPNSICLVPPPIKFEGG